MTKAEGRHTRVHEPLFSICIPQYNRTSFLLEACRSLVAQTFRDFEVCISDDCSTDGRDAEVRDFLQRSNLSSAYVRQPRNLRYDANLRASIALARGTFCFLLGNDDALAAPTTLEEVAADLRRWGPTGAVITNYETWATGHRFTRVPQTGILGLGPRTAIRHFRNFSFVSGILLERTGALRHATAGWDGSEMYQMYLGCRIVADGAPLLGLARITIRQGIRIPGESVDSYVSRAVEAPRSVRVRTVPLATLGRLVYDAVSPSLPPAERPGALEAILLQIWLFPYPYWLIEYRRVRSWQYAVGFCLGMSPHHLLGGLPLPWGRRWRCRALYGIMSVFGLWGSIRVFRRLEPRLYRWAKAFRSSPP